jgi:PAS domain S-box-containing protein
MNSPVRILYVDDYPLDRELVRDALERESGGFELVTAASRADFEAALAQGGFDLVLSDFNILGFEGLQVLETVRAKDSHLPVVIVTGTGSEEVAAEAIKRGAADYVLKTPKHIQHLPHTIHAVLENKRLEDERKQAEEALRASEARYQLIADHVGDIVWQLDIGLQFIYLSPAITRVLGYTVNEALGVHVTNFLNEDGIIRMKEVIQSRLKNPDKANEPAEYKMKHKDGHWVDVEVVSSPLFDNDGHPIGFAGITRNITERKQSEEKILAMNAELEKRVEERTRDLRNAQEQLVQQERLAVLGRLASGVAHELRNPLSVISNALYYLKLVEANGNEKVKEYLGIIEAESHTAENIITDLLDFERIKLADREPVSVYELIRLALDRFPTPPSVQVAFEIPKSLPSVYADPRQMSQALGNLIINAYQALGSPAGSSTSRVSASGKLTFMTHQEQEMIAIAVKDNGMGISPENMEKIFEPLFTTKSKGIGLGLAVSRKLIEANGGRIEVQSEAGKGSTFTVYLPVKVEAHPQ